MSPEFKTSLGNMVKPHLHKKYKNLVGHDGEFLSYSLGYWEVRNGAEMAGSPEPGKSSMIMSPHFSLVDRGRLCFN